MERAKGSDELEVRFKHVALIAWLATPCNREVLHEGERSLLFRRCIGPTMLEPSEVFGTVSTDCAAVQTTILTL